MDIVDNTYSPADRLIPNSWIIYPKIYKLNTAGKILIWYLQRDGANYRTISGQEDGRKTTSKWTTASAKNVGRVNATTAEEQAHKECLAKYEKKLSREYVDNKSKLGSLAYTKPMLAEPYYHIKPDGSIVDNRPHDFNIETYYVQYKLDGIRCLLNKNGMFSREGKPIISCPHIYDQVKHLFEAFPDLELDGELYNHQYKDNFNKLVSLIRKTKPEKEDLEESAKLIHYFIYDLASHTKASYIDRREFLSLFPITNNVATLLSYPVISREEIDEYLYIALDEGYEGVMIRKGSSLYVNKRSKNLLKYKKWEDSEFIIKDVLEGQGNNSGIAAKIAIEVKGKIVYPNMTGTWEYCEHVLKEKDEYIGGEATVEYAGFTPDGSLRFPRVKNLYKTKRDL